jgi:predicted MPP superfamily phosphohydrolase
VARKLLLSIALGVAVLLALDAFYLEPSSLEIERDELVVPAWPDENHGLSIALLSDLHVGSPFYGRKKLERVVREVNRADPDIVLLAGDYVIDGVLGGEFVPPEAIASVLASLHAPLGVYAVLGNHDWWYDGARVRNALTSQGIRVLDNESVRIQGDGFDFWLVGLGDVWESPEDVGETLEALPRTTDYVPILAFTHNPDLFPEVPARVALTLAGHTHGGQVRLPFLGAPILPSRYGQRYARGHVVEGGRHLFVTSGLGTSILPVRFRVPPEVALLTLEAGAERQTDTPAARRRRTAGSGR